MILRCALAASAVLLINCGYPGEPLPPALKRPVRIVDLNAVEHGSRVLIHFTIPGLTTEGLPVKGNEPLDVRIGPPPAENFNMNNWARSAQRISDADIRRDPPVANIDLSAAPFYNKTVLIAARALSPKGKDAGWSNVIELHVVPALPVPAGIEWKNAPDAVQLTWHAAAPNFRIFRKQKGQLEWAQIGTSDRPEYLDKTIDYGNTYDYQIQSIKNTGDDQYAESERAEIDGVTPIDTFAPAVPTGLTAVPGTKSIELVWNRNTEKDFGSYRLYRDGKLLAADIVSLAYSDRDVKPGAKYTYQISAVDKKGNESDKSAPVSAALP